MPDYTTPERDRIALLTFAVQNDCILPGSPVGYLGGRRTLARIGQLARGFRERGAPIVHLVRLYRPDGSNVDACRRRAVEEGLRVLMPGTRGVELADEVNPAPLTRLNGGDLLDGKLQRLAGTSGRFIARAGAPSIVPASRITCAASASRRSPFAAATSVPRSGPRSWKRAPVISGSLRSPMPWPELTRMAWLTWPASASIS